MSNLKITFATFALCLGTAVLISTTAAADGYYRESLRDLPGVYVVVEAPNAVAQAAGLDSGVVRLRVERYLAFRGVPLLKRESMHETSSAPRLHVQISTGSRGGEPIVWVANVVLYQNVTTTAAPAAVPAGTWLGLTGFGHTPPKRLMATVWSSVEGQLEDFAQDWLAANDARASESGE